MKTRKEGDRKRRKKRDMVVQRRRRGRLGWTKKKTAGRDGKTYRKKREKETRERQKRETEIAVKSEFGRNE